MKKEFCEFLESRQWTRTSTCPIEYTRTRVREQQMSINGQVHHQQSTIEYRLRDFGVAQLYDAHDNVEREYDEIEIVINNATQIVDLISTIDELRVIDEQLR